MFTHFSNTFCNIYAINLPYIDDSYMHAGVYTHMATVDYTKIFSVFLPWIDGIPNGRYADIGHIYWTIIVFCFWRSFRSIVLYIRRHLVVKLLAVLLVLLLLFKVTQPYFFSYTISYAKVIADMVNKDMQRHQDVMRQEAEVINTEY